jgi:hypothetical protein
VPGREVHAGGDATPPLVTGPPPQDTLVDAVPDRLGGGDQPVLTGDQREEVWLHGHAGQDHPRQALSVADSPNPPP